MRSLDKFSSTLIVSVDHVEMSKFSCSLSMKTKHLKISVKSINQAIYYCHSGACQPT